MKNKTIAVWLTLLLGALGLHRRYLLGRFDTLALLLPIPTLLGCYGVLRVRTFGVDDQWSWVLMPLLGFTLAGCALNAIVYGLMSAEHWNRKFNPTSPEDAPQGISNWITIIGLGLALMLGTTVLMASMAFSFQRYFEYQMERSSSLSQGAGLKESAD
ncbi:MAG: hypothetical protein EAZ11_10905 [Curvibacter sp.]|nr:MAG: hypothetical protein EAZ11_10905 [Curvibacter sp.]